MVSDKRPRLNADRDGFVRDHRSLRQMPKAGNGNGRGRPWIVEKRRGLYGIVWAVLSVSFRGDVSTRTLMMEAGSENEAEAFIAKTLETESQKPPAKLRKPRICKPKAFKFVGKQGIMFTQRRTG